MRKERAAHSSALRAKYIAVAVAAGFAPWSAYGQTPPPNQMPNVTVTRGDAVINPVTGTYQQIDQASLRAIYEGSMTMGSNAQLHLNHSLYGRSGIGLFKDISGSLSQIFGRITSNGQVFISNPNGVLFGSTARIDVGGLLATTLSTNDDQFMAGGARIQWTNNGATGTVINQGEIITASGYTALAGPQVRNDGIIRAQTGSVVLAAGDRVSLDLIGDGLISISVDQAALNASAINIGTIEADGGAVLLTARSANALLDTVVNASGIIRANSLIERNGEIVLDGGSAGTVMVANNHQAGSATVNGAAITMTGTITTGPGTGSQTITTPGTLSIQADGAQNAGLIHNGSGEQRVEAGNLVMTGGASGIVSSALLTSSDAAAEQRITVAGGNIQVSGGAGGDLNQAIIRSAGNQTIDGNARITVEGGASSGGTGSNTAFIVGATSNAPGKMQTIHAASVTMRSGAGGNQNGAVILGPKQEITTTGDVLLAAGSTGGQLGGVRMGGLSTGAGGAANTTTDLTLKVGNDLLITGGPGANNVAFIGSTTGFAQTVKVDAGRDVVLGTTGSGIGRIGTGAPVVAPGDISVTAGRNVQINSGGEILTLGAVTVKAENGAVNVAAVSPIGNARISSGTGQDIQAQSITVVAQNNRSAQLINQGIGAQSVKAGTVEIKTVAPIGGLAEIRNNSAGDQTVTVTGDKLDIKAVGGGTATLFGAGNQTVDMQRVGTKTITLGDNAAQGQSTIVNNGEQKILGYADIKMTGGSGPVANGSNAIIQSNSATRTQRIEANNLEMSNSTLGGNSGVAAILAAQQNIHALGNVTMTANASGGTLPGVRIGGLGGGGGAPSATNLMLTVDGDLILQGSTTTANNGVGIGSTGAVGAPALANNITIDAGGNVVLNAGNFDKSGVRIGSSTNTGTGDGPGDIRITAGGNISLNGTAQTASIRTQGDVTLTAASISEGSNGLIVGNTLTTTTTGVTNLAGPNEITRFNGTSGGVLTLVDAGGLQVTGISTTNDVITLTTDSLTNSGVISNGGPASTANVVLNADAFNLSGGTIEGGAAAVVLRPRTGTNSFGIESAGATTLTNADIASINTSNFIVFGSGIGTTFTGNMTIGENARVEGGAKNLAFFRGTAPGQTTIGSQGVTTTGDVIVSAGLGSINSNGGTVRGDEVQLRAGNGIGSALAPVRTAANALAMNNSSSAGVFVSELDNVTLRTISLNVGGMLNTFSNGTGGVLDFSAAGAVNVAGIVSSGPMTLTAGGVLSLDGSTQDAALLSGGGQTITAQSVNLIAQNGRRANIENTNGEQKVTATAGDMNLLAPGGGGVAQIVSTSSGDQTIEASGQLNVLGGATVGSTNSGIFKNGATGLQKVTAAGITLQGASSGTNAGAGIRSQSDQEIRVSGDINLRGGNGGNLNNAFIGASVTGQQKIYARDINMSNGVGGIDTSATITGGHQLIDITGNLTMTSQAALLGTAAGGPGVRIGAPGGSTLGTDLTLLVDGNITLNGGTAVENGVGIGSSGAGTPAPNNIHIEAGGNVVLNAGTLSNTGARIGSSSLNGTAGGNVSIEAGGTIELNGSARSAAIRTLGNVTLDAASISEGTNGFILADTLTVTTDGAANLAGPNDVARFNATTGGPLTLVDAGGLQVTGITTTNDTITLTTDSLTNTGVISNGGSGNIVFNADAFNLAGGTVEGGSAAVILRPRTGTNSFGIESAGQTTLTNADIASIHTSDFVVFGSGMGTTFTGSMTIGQNARVEGGDKNLAFFRSSAPGGTTTIGAQGVNTTGNLIVSAGGGAIVSEGGTVSGDQVQLRASQGIGSAAARVQTAANRLALNNTGPQGAFVFEAGDVTLGNVNLTVGGNVNNVANVIGGAGAYDVTAGGSITVADVVQAGSVALTTPGGSIIESGAGAIVANDLRTFSGQSTLLSGANQVASFNATSGSDVTLNNTGELTVTGLSAGGNATLDNVGNITITGPWTAGGTSQITAHSDIVLGAVLTSANVALQADGSITESGMNGVGAVVADTLTTVSGGSTFLGGENHVASYNGTSGADLFFFNRGDLNVTGLHASTASLSNEGALTISGPWITAGQTNITSFGVGSSIAETAGGFIQATGFNSLSAQGSVSLNGANRISGTLTGSSMQGDFSLTNAGDLNFGAFSSFGDVGLVNAGALNVTGLSGRNLVVNNAGPMTVSGNWFSTGTTSITTAGAAADLTVNNTVNSQGLMTISVDGALTVAASGQLAPPPGFPPSSFPQFASLTSSGGQNITARSVVVSAQDGALALINNQGTGDQTFMVSGGGIEVRSSGTPGSTAQIGNFASGSQTIRVSGGSIDVQANSGNASISHGGAGLGQSILVTDGDHINVNGAGGTAIISANGGTQTVSITGTGANAISLGSTGARGFSQIAGGSTQNVTAGGDGERGSITITGSAVNGPTASIVSRTSADGTQTVSTSGLIRVVGGTASSQPNAAGIFHNGTGEQKVSAARIELEGGASGNNNAAIIASSGGGVPANAGAQTITVSGDIVIAGGAGGNAGISGPVTRLQKIRAHNIDMTNSALGGNNSVGFILGGHQDILATGNVTMTARASGGDLPGVRIGGQSANPAIGFPGAATDLKLVVGGDLVLSGGTALNNGVGIGSTAAPGPALANDITIDVGGNVILNAGSLAGTGARIGSSANTGAGAGDIRITAGGDIRLNGVDQGTAIRTLGNVTLEAASIVEASRGIIEANALTTSTSGDTLLNGRNQVSSFTASSDHGNVQLTNTSAVLSLGSMDLPRNLAIVQTGDLTVGGSTSTQATLVAAAGDISMSASSQILVRGSDTTIGAASAVLAGGGLSFSAGDVTLRAGDAALTPVVVRGANGVQMTVGNELNVTAGGLLSPSLLTSGRNIDLTIGHALRIDGSGPFSLARVQTESRDGVISISFPNLTHGGYFVDGKEGHTNHGQTGFFTDFKPAKVGKTLLLDYN